MEKKNTVKKALEAGVLLTPAALESVDEKTFDEALKRAEKEKKIVITSRFFSGAPEEPPVQKGPAKPADKPKEVPARVPPAAKAPTPEPAQTPATKEPPAAPKPRALGGLVIKKKDFPAKSKLGPQDFAKFYNNKYKGIQEILLKKVNAVSINKARGLFSDVAVIGMVRELVPKGFILEDPTGDIEVVSRDKAPPDDVIGIKGLVRESKLFPNEFLWPDVPLSREMGKIENARILLAPRPANISGVDAVISPEDKNPVWLSIERDKERVCLVIFRPPEEFTLNRAVAWLKKRHLPHKKEHIPGPEDPFLLVPIPDIIWFLGGKEDALVYKGVTMVSSNERFVKVNLGTMGVDFI